MKYTGKDHTFVVCAFGESPYLRDCLLSLKRQTVKSRIFICTATPNRLIDTTAQENRISVQVNPAGPGIASDWNYALSLANTPLVTLVHQDDIYEPEYLLWILKALRRAEKPLIAFTDYYEIRDGEKIGSKQSRMLLIKEKMLLPLRSRKLWSSRAVRRGILSFGNPICCPSVTYVKKNLPEPLFQEHFRASLDWEAWERLSRLSGEFVYLHESLMGHRIHELSTTTEVIGSNHGRAAEDLAMYRKFWPEGIARLLNHFYTGSQDNNFGP